MKEDILDEGLFEQERILDEESIRKINKVKIDTNESIRHVSNGRNAMIVLAVVTLVVSVIAVASADIDYSELLIVAGFNLLVYLASAILTPRNPSIFLTAGALIWVLLILINAIISPMSLISGILWKAIIGYFLSLGVSHAFQLKQHQQNLYDLGVSRKELDKIRQLDKIPLSNYPRKTNNS